MEDLETFDGFPDDQDLPDIPAVPGTADPAPSQCWGGELSGDARHCTPGFVPGSNHLKSKWCAHCTQFGIVVAASRVRAIGTELHGTLTNGRGSGMYMHLPVQPADAAQPARAPPRYRLINQTKDCRGPRMVVFENPTPPPELEDLWSPMPPGVVSYKKIRAAAGPVSFGFGSCVAPATSLVSHIAILATSPPHTFATPFVASRSASAATRRLTTSSGRLKNTARVRYCAAITGVFQISSWSNFPVL